MRETDLLWMSALVFLPSAFALGLLFFPKESKDGMRWWSLFGTAATLGVSLIVFVLWQSQVFEKYKDTGDKGSLNYRAESATEVPVELREKQMLDDWVARVKWIDKANIYYFLGIDGISMALILLTTVLTFLSMIASWKIDKYVRGYCMLFLILETGMLGTFVALDFFLFYIFWEVMLLPMYFLIGIWGGPRREYAAIKFFLYTLLGSVFILIALLAFYFTDVQAFAPGRKTVNAETKESAALEPVERAIATLKKQKPWNTEFERTAEATRLKTLGGEEGKQKLHELAAVHTFDLIALQKVGKAALVYLRDGHLDALSAEDAPGLAKLAELHGSKAKAVEIVTNQWFFSKSFQITMFLLLFVGFAIKLPMFPFHTWLPDAHVEAPTPISMILAGVLLKMGGYGILRICYPICPWAAQSLAWFVVLFGIINIVYGAFAAMAQTDFKKLVAYSSVSHMGYVIIGIAVWSTGTGADAWKFGLNGAMYQMLGHGISSAGMFFLVGVIYDRAHHRNLDNFRGLYEPMPLYSAMAAIIFFAGLGLPGLCGFVGEVMTVLATWQFDKVFAVLAALTVVLTAAYILWTIQRVFLGTNPAYKDYQDMDLREILVGAPLVVLAVVLGVYPDLVFRWMEPSVSRFVDQVAQLTR